MLHKWQSECLSIWSQNGYRGIVNAVTGSGKTVLALAAVKHLENTAARGLCVKIVVPQTFLAAQWKNEIKRHLGIKAADIGLYCGKHKDTGLKFMIYVVNSARYCLARHILGDINNGHPVLLIADECHHYGSGENSRIFDFYKIIDKKAPYYSLGLSATPEVVNFSAISTPLGREIYSYNLGMALRDRIISRFILFSISLNFTPAEGEEYEELSSSLAINLAKLRKKHPELARMPPNMFFTHLQRLAKQKREDSSVAQTALTLMYKRRTLCHLAEERPHCVVSIVGALPAQAKIILFCERILAAERMHRYLLDYYPSQVGVYHSKMADVARNEVLEQYRHGTIRLLICCKALDEGLDIPSTDAGIIVSTSKSARQRIQRLGRMLRHSKEIKRVFYLYVEESSEDSELVLGLNALDSSVPMIALHYTDGCFIHEEYERLRENVLGYVSGRRYDPELLCAMNSNIDRVLLRGDFLMSEPACRDNLLAARTIAERNYWTVALYVILARMDKL